MSGLALPKLAASRLDEVASRLDLPPPAAEAVAECEEVPAALLRLVQDGFMVEASRLVAHALPKREAVWWACMCALHTAPETLPPADLAAREAAEMWVRKQTDALRRQAMEQAQVAGFATPEAWAAVGAFWSGDSMSPLGQPVVPPAPHLAGTAVAGAIALAAVRARPERQKARLVRFLESARDIAAGGSGRLPPEEE
ncbi:MAG TPA: hypothetical protein VMU82_05180 [Acetobacteraceae bacterium]|nr:hypothetical protein [Acetobacteraceae bacterium]